MKKAVVYLLMHPAAPIVFGNVGALIIVFFLARGLRHLQAIWPLWLSTGVIFVFLLVLFAIAVSLDRRRR